MFNHSKISKTLIARENAISRSLPRAPFVSPFRSSLDLHDLYPRPVVDLMTENTLGDPLPGSRWRMKRHPGICSCTFPL